MRRPPPVSSLAYAFGPGPATPAVKLVILVNITVFLITALAPSGLLLLGLRPADVIGRFWVWQVATYMFVHGGLFHLLFNMLAVWMFGVDLERIWGTRAFVRYYFVTGLGGAATMLLISFVSETMYFAITVGASGAVYGLLLAYGLRFPDRPIYMYLVFLVPAKYFVMIIGAISFFLSVSDARGGVAHAAHLGGLICGFLYLTGGRNLGGELRYRYLRWKMDRMRRRFEVHRGGRGGKYDRWVH